MSSAPQVVLDLVERFAHNLDAYHRPDYNETQVRREFIDPLFTALGWDVDNRQGVSPRYQEVIHEVSLREKDSVRAPDYGFRVGSETRFYVEAKKPVVDVYYDVHPAYQLRRYAWTAKLPLSILTDFEEFSVYDCRIPPKPSDKAATARILYLNYQEYTERWEEVATIFSREAVLRGDYDRFAESTRDKRGTQEVDAVFLQEMEDWRALLASNIALRNPELTTRDLNYAVQAILDRIIFLRICEDRDVESYEQLRNILPGDGVYGRLLDQFRRADERYNSGLFHFREERGRAETPDTLTPTLRLDDKVLREIIGKLYYPHSPYAFRVLGVDVLGSVYERFLGSVIRLTLAHRAVVEQKPEVRKAGGVYYTPKYIVDYIVQHTVGQLIEGKTPGEIARLRILDAACGSGSFLLGAYQYLLDYHLNWYVEHPTKQARREVYQGRGGEWFLTTDEKKRILLNNLYGVDIDSQAVEVTKLSLLLKVLEGENRDTLATQLRMFRERALPDLASNIKWGNSLIGPDYPALLLTEDEQYRVNPFNWERAFPQVFAQGGFDVVIGNPPYIRIQTMKEWAPKEVEFYKQRYVAASKGNYDIYVVFVEKGLSLLNARGRLGFILPHKFFNAQYGESLRRLIAAGKHLAEVVHFGDQQVFENATTYTCLMFLDKAGNNEARIERVSDLAVWRTTGEATTGRVLAEHITAGEWNLVVGAGTDLFRRLSEMPVKLGDVAERIFQGLVTGADPVLILENRKKGLYFSEATQQEHSIETQLMHPLCKGSVNLKRYHITELSKSILFPYKLVDGKADLLSTTELAEDYPLAWAYLRATRDLLESRERGKWRHSRWYAFGRSQNLSEMEQTKILTPSIARCSSFTLDTDDFYYFVGSGGGGGGGYGITLRHDERMTYEYILGLLNSKLLDTFLKSSSSPFSGGYYAYNRQYIEQLPIRPIDFSDPADAAQHDEMVALVERMLALHQELAAAKTPSAKTMIERQIAATDQQIDRLVYELYGLTEEEIAIVEAS